MPGCCTGPSHCPPLFLSLSFSLLCLLFPFSDCNALLLRCAMCVLSPFHSHLVLYVANSACPCPGSMSVGVVFLETHHDCSGHDHSVWLSLLLCLVFLHVFIHSYVDSELLHVLTLLHYPSFVACSVLLPAYRFSLHAASLGPRIWV